jgi:Membrane domain of glycerophosphoryl diester phosphodiesterase
VSNLTISARRLLIDSFNYVKPVYFPILAFFVPTILITLIVPTITSPSANVLLKFIEWIFIYPFSTGASIFYAHQSLTQRGATVPSSLQAAGEKFTQLSLVSVLLIVFLIPAFILLIVPGIYLSIRWSFIFYAIMIEGYSASDALSRSWKLTRGHWWLILRAGLLFFTLALLPILLLTLFIVFTLLGSTPELSQLTGGIIAFLIAPIGSIYYVLLFMTLVNMAMDEENK